jgi:hypothetical protein
MFSTDLKMPNVYKPVALAAGTAETTVWTPTTGTRFRLMGFILTVDTACVLTFKDNTAGATIMVVRLAADTPLIVPNVWGNGILSGAANRVLTVTRGASCALSGTIWGTEE